MSSCGETLNFHLSSVGRNRFIQNVTGLFGGDIDSGLLSYPITDAHYRSSMNYVSTVTAEGGTCQRAALAAWYLLGSGTLRDSGALTWDISHNLWYTVQQPGQCVTFIDNGVLIYATLGRASTQTLARIEDASSIIPGPFPRIMSFSLRPRRPRQTINGPIIAANDNQTVVIQVDTGSFAPPIPGRDLVYLGARGSHPVHTAAWQSSTTANQYVFGVDSVVQIPNHTNIRALRPIAIPTDWQTWMACSDNAVIGVCGMASNVSLAFAGIDYPWPFPVDQAGSVLLLLPSATNPALSNTSTPDAVFFVRALVLDGMLTTTGTVDGVDLVHGDRVAIYVTNPPSVTVWEWQSSATYAAVTITPNPASPLVVVEGGVVHANQAWWNGHAYQVAARQQHTGGDSTIRLLDDAPVPPDPTAALAAIATAQAELKQAETDLQTIVDAVVRATNTGTVGPSLLTQTAAVARVASATANVAAMEAAAIPQDDPPVNHVLVVLTRTQDGWYPPHPTSVVSSLYTAPTGWTWTYPLAPGDRFIATGLTDGLIGSNCVDRESYNISSLYRCLFFV